MTDQTPEWLCKEMASRVPGWVETILEPTPGDGNLTRALLPGNYSLTLPRDIFSYRGSWDCVVMNPPFSPGKLCNEILEKVMSATDYIITVLLWTNLTASDKRFKRIQEFGLKRVTHLPRRTFGNSTQCCLLEMQRGFGKECIFDALQHPDGIGR